MSMAGPYKLFSCDANLATANPSREVLYMRLENALASHVSSARTTLSSFRERAQAVQGDFYARIEREITEAHDAIRRSDVFLLELENHYCNQPLDYMSLEDSTSLVLQHDRSLHHALQFQMDAHRRITALHKERTRGCEHLLSSDRLVCMAAEAELKAVLVDYANFRKALNVLKSAGWKLLQNRQSKKEVGALSVTMREIVLNAHYAYIPQSTVTLDPTEQEATSSTTPYKMASVCSYHEPGADAYLCHIDFELARSVVTQLYNKYVGGVPHGSF